VIVACDNGIVVCYHYIALVLNSCRTTLDACPLEDLSQVTVDISEFGY
jgi:hypothetical protein